MICVRTGGRRIFIYINRGNITKTTKIGVRVITKTEMRFIFFFLTAVIRGDWQLLF